MGLQVDAIVGQYVSSMVVFLGHLAVLPCIHGLVVEMLDGQMGDLEGKGPFHLTYLG